jgi:hypothetical protein
MTKREALRIINNQYHLGLNSYNTTFSNINGSVPLWWFEPASEKFKFDFNLVLNNNRNNTLYYFCIPEGEIRNPREIFYVRQDNYLLQLKININNYNFTDNYSGFNFRNYLREVIHY